MRGHVPKSYIDLRIAYIASQNATSSMVCDFKSGYAASDNPFIHSCKEEEDLYTHADYANINAQVRLIAYFS